MQAGTPEAGQHNTQVRRVHAAAAVIAGCLGIISGAGLAWSLILLIEDMGGLGSSWRDEYVLVAVLELALLVSLVAAAALTLRRVVSAAWVLCVLGLITVVFVFIEPLIVDEPLDIFVQGMITFAHDFEIAYALVATCALLASVSASVAAVRRTEG
jgi:hypothetical protein